MIHANLIRQGTRMSDGSWLISKCRLAGCAALATVGAAVTAAELFPYNPPPSNAAQQMQQRAPQRVELSAEERGKIDLLAREIGKLAPEQKKKVRTEVQIEQDKAASRSDLKQFRYYGELLRRIDNGR